MPPGRKYYLFVAALLFLLLFSVRTYSQNWHYSKSEPVYPIFQTNDANSSTQREYILDENFLSASNGWILGNSGKIANGTLLVERSPSNAGNSNEGVFLPLNLDQSKDFEIVISLSVNSKSAGVFSIIMGQIYWNFRSSKAGFGKAEKISSWVSEKKQNDPDCDLEIQKKLGKEKGEIKIGHFQNRFRIRKMDNELLYSINDETEISTPFYPLLLQRIGFCSGGGQSLTIESTTVSYILKIDQPANRGVILSYAQPLAPAGIEARKKPGEGKYFALIVGVSVYDDQELNLDEPVPDAQKLKTILTSRYCFTDSSVSLVFNPTREMLLYELFRLRKIIGPDDNLLIFYAGHGYWDEAARQGYWWPRNAATGNPSNWLSNSDLREQIRSIKSLHTLLISDACFSGGIFKTRDAGTIVNASNDIQQLYALPSRRAMTSGTLTTVPDRSAFLEYLCKRLQDNTEKFFSSQSLFDRIRAAVINNSGAVPQDGVIADTGDEGGDFIFVLKDN